MKQTIAFLLTISLLLFLASCNKEKLENHERVQRGEPSLYINSEETEPSISEKARLIVNGKDITEGNYVRINHTAKYAELPIAVVLKELGYEVEVKHDQNTDSYAVIIDDNTKFLDTQYEDYGFPIGYGDTDYVRRIVDDEIIVDSDAIFTVMYWGYFAEIEINYNTNTVYVNSCDPYASVSYVAKLVVNGKDITKGNYISLQKFDNYIEVEMPLLAVVAELGAEIEWQSEKVVAVTYNGNTETYDTSESDFGVYGPDGGVHIRKIENDDLVFDLSSIEGILEEVYGVIVKVDTEACIVYVDSKKAGDGFLS